MSTKYLTIREPTKLTTNTVTKCQFHLIYTTSLLWYIEAAVLCTKYIQSIE